ncbi:MAG: prephenate dehydrogenase/arogenate dehydrogenase family protein [Candidatus Bathyarchaeota archaeon]|nr:prephenate dehydrogenase/arogenate dehydrogenase family protein [Candidatus Bathyarchaeota archaeon]MCX8176720.1 prephenate dehydrogenase/arogenate dehydrogenase family protein [Candidatus Bathyarchaeota archaeon]MDW8193248.1 prephenate dehydrogenase/arogenate dehydrogenase family protein [Nitrososphaerota archaeon]
MKIAIIGVGRMGRWFAKFFVDEGFHVVVSDESREKALKLKEELNVEVASNVEAVKNADRILICVPIENFQKVVEEIHPQISPGQEVMDICSVKALPVKIMHNYIKQAVTLGTHPMFGPGVKSVKNQKFILTPTNSKEEKLAENFKRWLEEKGFRVFFMSPEEHDRVMSTVIGLPYLLSYAACDALLSQSIFSEAKKVSGASYRILITLIEAIASENAEFTASLQMNLPEVDVVGEKLLEKIGDWLETVRKGDKKGFIDKVDRLKSRLANADPDYAKSYETMYKMLDAIKNES